MSKFLGKKAKAMTIPTATPTIQCQTAIFDILTNLIGSGNPRWPSVNVIGCGIAQRSACIHYSSKTPTEMKFSLISCLGT